MPSVIMKANTRRTGTAGSRIWILIGALLLVGLQVWVYGQVAGFEAISLDDPQYVFDNPHITSPLSVDTIAWALTGNVKGHWGPLVWFSFMMDHHLWGAWAGGYHLTNLLFHILNSLLCLWVFYRYTGSALTGFTIGALLAVHPVHTESVCWITERKDVLFLFFGFLCLLAYHRWVKRPGAASRGVMLACFILGLCAKSMLVTLPVLMLLLDYWPLDRLSANTALDRAREKWPLFAIALAVGALTLIMASRSGPVDPLDAISVKSRFLNALHSYRVYMEMLFRPDAIEFYPRHPGAPALVHGLTNAGLLLAVTAVLVVWRKRVPAMLVGWLWFLISLVPVIGLIQLAGQAWGARFLYLPALGIYLALAGTITRLRTRAEPIIALILIILVPLAIQSRHQAGYWQNARSLYARTVEINPANYWAWGALAMTYQKEGRFMDAYRRYQRALEVHPGYVPALAQIARMAVIEGNQTRDMKKKIALYRFAESYLDRIDALRPGLVSDQRKAIRSFFDQLKRP